MNAARTAQPETLTFRAWEGGTEIVVTGHVVSASKHWFRIRTADGSVALCHVDRLVRN